MTESFAELFEESLASQRIKPGAILSATVVDINSEMVVVNAGLKSEAVIPVAQFHDERGDIEVVVGDIVEVALDTFEDGFGETRLSREKAKRARTWTRLETAFEDQEIVQGIINGRVKGGFTVEMDNVRAFLPGSLVDVRPVRDPAYLEGKVLDFKVIKLDARRNNVVVSRRAVVEAEYSAEREELLKTLQEGAVLSGIVKNLTDYGAFVDLGGIDGLLHITDMAWKRVKQPSDVVQVGQEIQVKVLKFDRERQRVSLGIKQLGADPWESIERRYPQNTRLFGKITNIADYGCFVEIEEGVEGLVHVSEMDWTNKNVNPAKVVQVGKEVEGKVLDFKVIKLDARRNNVVVSRRAVVEAEYSAEREELLKTLQEGAVLSGIVKNLTDYGAFVDLGGIDGLLHITDMAWKRVKQPSDVVQVGQEIQVKVLKFDRERQRVSLGIKQLGADPWESIERRYPQNTRLFGKITNIADYGCFVEIEEGVEGLVHVSEMDWTNKNVNPAKVVQVGEEVEVMVLDIDEERRRISLGIKQCKSNPWADFSTNFNKSDRVSGQIKSITDFGIFIGLSGGIDGLVHLSDLSWDIPGEEAVRDYKKGDEVEAVVLAIDSERERISLGIKQLDKDPFSSYIAEHPRGSIVTGIVEEVDAKGGIIDLGQGIKGQLRASELSRDRVEDARTALKVGQEISAKFTGIERRSRMISLSIKAKEAHEESQAMQSYTAEGSGGGTSLGDLLRDQIPSNDNGE